MGLATAINELTPPSPEREAAFAALDLVAASAYDAIARNECWTRAEAWQLVDSTPGAAAHQPIFDARDGSAGPNQGQAEDRDREREYVGTQRVQEILKQKAYEETRPARGGEYDPSMRMTLAHDGAGIVTRYRS